MNTLTRRRFLALTGGAIGAAFTPAARSAFSFPSGVTGSKRFYVGTYSDGASKGIYRCAFDPEDGTIEVLGATGGVTNPSFLAIHPRGSHLFAVGETAEFAGLPGGSVHAFRIDGQGGGLTHLNSQPSHGPDPAYISIDARGRYVLVANYSGGNVCVFPVRMDGRLDTVVANVRHTGSGPNPKRQERPHAHSVILDPANRRAFSADLGIDRVMVYSFNRESGAVSPAAQPELRMKPGAGPRHLAFSPDGKRLFVVNELDSTVVVFSYDVDTGVLEELDSVSTLPDSFAAANACADIHVHPSGMFVYASNRGHDSIAVFRIDVASGKLTPVQRQSTGGASPRNFAIDPSARFLLAANQRSDSIVVMRINERDGTLAPTGATASIPSPVCIRFMPGT
jgi:6-phosphogluconolactonase